MKKYYEYPIISVLMPIALFALWAYNVMNGHLEKFDLAVQAAVFSARCTFLTPIGVALEYVGHWPLPALVSIILLIKKDTRFAYGIPMATIVASSVGIYELLKHIFKRARPDQALWLCQEHGYSFPSGHTLNNTVFWIVFASLLYYYYATKGKSLPLYNERHRTKFYPKTKKWMNIFRFLLVFWPLLIGISRIYVGVHWPSDVVGSLILSTAIIQIERNILFKQKTPLISFKKKEARK